MITPLRLPCAFALSLLVLGRDAVAHAPRGAALECDNLGECDVDELRNTFLPRVNREIRRYHCAFRTDTADLLPNCSPKLEKVAAILRKWHRRFAPYRTGHFHIAVVGAFSLSTNQEVIDRDLSRNRARAIADLLITTGAVTTDEVDVAVGDPTIRDPAMESPPGFGYRIE